MKPALVRVAAFAAATALSTFALTACGSDDKDDAPGADADGSTQPRALTAEEQAIVDRAESDYRVYVQDESAQLLSSTEEFLALYEAGKDEDARALYPVARGHWERIETVAESFGDLDPKMDAREADVDVAAGEEWTGWHVIEKDLWPARAEGYMALTSTQRTDYADDLLANTVELDRRIQDDGPDALAYPIDAIADGARGLLEEVANGKVTGEEEFWSRTDLWDFQANIDGARVAFEGVQPMLVTTDPDLSDELTGRFDELQLLLDSHRDGAGFVFYDELTQEDIDALAAAVNALSEPLSHLSAAVVS